jgi:enoyl-[acyl-carrier protein] reductase II
MFEGDLEQGELEIGQVSALLRDVLPAGEILRRVLAEYNASVAGLQPLPAQNAATGRPA